MEPTQQKITLYSGASCPKCMFIERQLSDKGIEFTEVNISKEDEAREELKAQGFMFVPILKVNEEYIGELIKINEFLETL